MSSVLVKYLKKLIESTNIYFVDLKSNYSHFPRWSNFFEKVWVTQVTQRSETKDANKLPPWVKAEVILEVKNDGAFCKEIDSIYLMTSLR